MVREVHLLTSLSVFEQLHKLADGRRAQVSLPRDTLAQLLVDHTVLVTACKAAGIKLCEPLPPKRARSRLA